MATSLLLISRTKDRACDSLAFSRRSPHEEGEPGTGKGGGVRG